MDISKASPAPWGDAGNGGARLVVDGEVSFAAYVQDGIAPAYF